MWVFKKSPPKKEHVIFATSRLRINDPKKFGYESIEKMQEAADEATMMMKLLDTKYTHCRIEPGFQIYAPAPDNSFLVKDKFVFWIQTNFTGSGYRDVEEAIGIIILENYPNGQYYMWTQDTCDIFKKVIELL